LEPHGPPEVRHEQSRCGDTAGSVDQFAGSLVSLAFLVWFGSWLVSLLKE
jgi:hypothetical protein